MSIRVMNWVWEHGPEDRGEMLVLLALADHADDAGVCYPAMAAIARKARMTERGARKIVRRLEEVGALQTQLGNGRGGCNVYRIVTKNPERRSPIADANPEPRSSRNGVPPEPRDTKPGTARPKTRNGGSAEPSVTIIEPSVVVTPARADGDAEIVATLSQAMPRATAEDFVAHRKAKRAKLTPRAAELITQSLAGHPDPQAVVEKSIANGWTGVFPNQRSANERSDRSAPNGEAVSRRTAAFLEIGRRHDRDRGN